MSGSRNSTTIATGVAARRAGRTMTAVLGLMASRGSSGRAASRPLPRSPSCAFRQPPKSAIRNGSSMRPNSGCPALRSSRTLRKPYFTKMRCASSLQRNCAKRVDEIAVLLGHVPVDDDERVLGEDRAAGNHDVRLEAAAALVVHRLLLVGDERVPEAVLELRARRARRGGLGHDVVPDPRQHRLAGGRVASGLRGSPRRTPRRSPSSRRPRSGDPDARRGRRRARGPEKSAMPSGLPGRTKITNGVRFTTPPSGSRFQLPAGITWASASRSASLSSESSASSAGAPRVIWFVIVPEPAKELRNVDVAVPLGRPLLPKRREDAFVHDVAEDAETVEDDRRGRRGLREGQPGPRGVEQQRGEEETRAAARAGRCGGLRSCDPRRISS